MKRTVFLLFIILIYSNMLHATHQRAAEITYRHVSGLTYEFTVTMYTRTSSPADDSRVTMPIYWGDNTADELPREYFKPIPDVDDVTLNIYRGEHTFPGPATYTISVEDPNRNYGVLNIPNSVNVPIYVETTLVINPFLGYNNSVELLNPPIDQGCVGKTYIHNPGAYDIDGDSLSYRLVVCKGAGGFDIPGYSYPLSSDYFQIDAFTGDIIWETPVLQGEYNVAFVIEEWRFGTKISSVRRDMQINIVACDHDPPDIYTIDDTCVVAGDFLQFEVTAIDPDATYVELTAFGGPFEQTFNPAYIQPDPATGNDTVSVVFNWPTLCNHVRLSPYSATFKAKDNGFPVNLVNFKTVFIQVIAPQPENLEAEALGIGINLTWESSICTNAIGYKIYRRESPSGWDPDLCETGVPAYTGFKLIQELDGTSVTSFRDDNNGNGLVVGVDYCYRVTAAFFDGAESIASNEACAYLKRDVPVITHVSNDSSDLLLGNVLVDWTKPVELDTIQFPGPYRYVLLRSEGLVWNNPQQVAVFTGLDDTSYYDRAVNINEQSFPYSYKIDLESETVGYIGSSQQASSIYLETFPTDHEIKLEWSPLVPWTNYLYFIFRKDPGESDYRIIDSTTQLFYRDMELVNGLEYCYYLSAHGRYTIPGIQDPLINISQLTCAVPVDNIPPCQPELSVFTDCEQVSNELRLYLPYDSCSYDALKYYVYYIPPGGTAGGLIDSVSFIYGDTSYYLHTDIENVVGCYYATAIDSVGNISQPSVIRCVGYDACPVYALPNVFSPNGDSFNDLLIPMDGQSSNPKANVDRIDLAIFNRWGKVMFTTTDPAIKWDGKNKNNNQDCEEGVYYYVCDVFIVTLEGEQKIRLQGSVSIVR